MTNKSSLYIMHHTHWDREWYEPFALYQLRLGHVLQAILDRLDSEDLPRFTLDGQTSLVADALAFGASLEPDLKPRLLAHIQSGKLSVGPWCVSPDEWLVCGDALVRNLQRGLAESDALGQQGPFVGYLPDTFGHSADMPDLLQAVGIHQAIVWRGVPPHLSPVFWWHSPTQPDVKILVYHLPQGYFQNVLHDPDLTVEQRQTGFQALVNDLMAAHKGLPVLLPLGGDHLGPTPDSSLLNGLPTVHPAAFMALLANALPADIPHYTGELLDNTAAHVLPGVWSARLDVKIANRMAEHALLHRVEPALAWLRQQPYPIPGTLQAGLDEAWRLLLLNHPHDSICGCSVDAVHAENLTRFDAVLAVAERLEAQALHVGLGGTGLTTGQTGKAHPKHVLTHWGKTPFTGVVPVTFCQLPDDDTVLHLPQVAAVEDTTLLNAYETDVWDVPLSHLRMRKTTGWVWAEGLAPGSVTPWQPETASLPRNLVHVTPCSLGNGLIQLSIDDHSVAGPGQWTVTQGALSQSGLFQLSLQGEQGDSYNSAPDDALHWAVFTGCQAGAGNPLLAGCLQLQYALDGIPVQVTVELLADQPFLTITVSWFNTRPNAKLTAWLTQPDPLTHVWAESHTSMVQRHYPLPHKPSVLPVPRGQEWLPPTGPIQRFVQTPTQCVITQGLTEYAVDQNRLGITLHRGFSHISRGDNPTRNMPAGPPFPTPAAQLLNQPLTRRIAVGLHPTDPAIGFRWTERFYGVTQGKTVWLRASGA
jgi:mannosylglycerate hydrolase